MKNLQTMGAALVLSLLAACGGGDDDAAAPVVDNTTVPASAAASTHLSVERLSTSSKKAHPLLLLMAFPRSILASYSSLDFKT